MIEFFSEFTSKMENRSGTLGGHGNKKLLPCEMGNADVIEDKNDGSISDSAMSAAITDRRKRQQQQPTISNKVAALVGFSKKSRSTSQIGGVGRSKILIVVLSRKGAKICDAFVLCDPGRV